VRDIPTSIDLYRSATEQWKRAEETSARSLAMNLAEFSAVQLNEETSVPTSRLATKWVRALLYYEQFWRVNGRAPRENSRSRDSVPVDERRRGEWARYQRRFVESLSPYQQVRLDVSPAFEWDPLDAQWRNQLNACVLFVIGQNRLPTLNSRDPEEFRAARWLARQLRASHRRTLAPDRAAALTDLLRRAQEGGEAP
jgi:hypothetical protein